METFHLALAYPSSSQPLSPQGKEDLMPMVGIRDKTLSYNHFHDPRFSHILGKAEDNGCQIQTT
jgi:hypothetical protein